MLRGGGELLPRHRLELVDWVMEWNTATILVELNSLARKRMFLGATYNGKCSGKSKAFYCCPPEADGPASKARGSY